MYSTCLFCNGPLGHNEAIEHFPVGRRLAFDGAKGRLWVVCRKCERWNLTPLEERWEAIEECERAFRATKLRASTEHIGLARLKEGVELVRIGEPQRPEMAAWRYGDQFGRRRRNFFVGTAVVAFSLEIVGKIGIAGGVLGMSSAMPILYGLNIGYSAWKSRRLVHIPLGDGTTSPVRGFDFRRIRLFVEDDTVKLGLPVFRRRAVLNLLDGEPGWDEHVHVGDNAMKVASSLLPKINGYGGSRAEVSRAVEFLEQSNDPAHVFRRAAEGIAPRRRTQWFVKKGVNTLFSLPSEVRLALEMSTHEEAERRALEGELHVLSAAWRAAEEIAGIADNLLLPDDVADRLTRLKQSNNRD